jgi:hypothetical protein
LRRNPERTRADEQAGDRSHCEHHHRTGVTASLWAISFHTFQIGAAPQNFASVVWSAVRVVLEFWPRLLTWLSALA